MQCSECGKQNEADARFCSACGTSLAPMAEHAASEADASHLDLLHRYISRPLADKMQALGKNLDGERRHVTVVFADISGFTAMSETLDPEDVTTVMNACFKELVEVVFKYEGTIDKFIGDEIMALFGAPIAHENDPERAVRAALEMQERLREFNNTVEVSLPRPLTMHVGINSGEVIAGNVGSDLRMDYSVMGDTVNLAARLEAASDSGQIFVAEKTHALTRHVFEFRKLRPLKVQGKRRKVQAYEVQGIKGTPESARGVQAGYGPLVDREVEVELLRDVKEAVKQGRTLVLGVVGEAGIGKSRLVHELCQIADGFTIAAGSCTAYEAPAAYQIFTDVMRELLRIEEDDSEPVVRQKVQAFAVANDLDAEAVAPYLGSLFAVRDERLLHLLDNERQRGLKDALLSVFQALTRTHPLLLVLEDLHWIDPSSRRLLNELVEEAWGMPLLICCVYRPEFEHDWQGNPSYCTLVVEALSLEHTAALSEALLRLQLPPELGGLIVDRAEGNPFYVEEMIKALLDEGVIAQTSTGHVLSEDVGEVRLPETIQGIIMSRIDRLEAQAQETLQYASVIGRRFSDTLLRAVSPRAQQVEKTLEQLQSLELVYQHSVLPDLEYIFKHFVTREVAYNSILAKRRKAIHLDIARAIEHSYRDRLDDYYEALAHHFEVGEDWQKAAEYFGRAGTKSRELHSDEGATGFFDRQDQALQRVFEQREKGPWFRWPVRVATYTFPILIVYLIVVIDDPVLWTLGLLGLAVCILVGVGYARNKTATHLTVYQDRLVIRDHRGVESIPYDSIVSVRWERHLNLWEELKEEILGWLWVRYVYGSGEGRGAIRDLYFEISHRLKIAVREGLPIVLASSSAGALYKHLELAMERWAVRVQTDISDTFSTDSRIAAQQSVALREADGTRVSPVTYEELVELVEDGSVGTDDELRLPASACGEEEWTTLGVASREDQRLWAALNPIGYSAKCWYRSAVTLLLSVGVLPWFIGSVSSAIGDWSFISVFHWDFALFCLLTTVAALFPGFGVHLRIGFLDWLKQYGLSRWQRAGLRVLTGLGVAAVAVGLYVECFQGKALAIPPEIRKAIRSSRESRYADAIVEYEAALRQYPGHGRLLEELGFAYQGQGNHQKAVEILGPPVYRRLLSSQQANSTERHTGAVQALGPFLREKSERISGLGLSGAGGHTRLAVSLAKLGDIAGGRAVIEALIDGGEQLYGSFSLSELDWAHAAFAEIYLIDHTVLPDGTGLAEFEDAVAHRDPGPALAVLGLYLHDQGQDGSALAAYRRSLSFLEPSTSDWQWVQKRIEDASRSR